MKQAFRTFYGVLRETARRLTSQGVTHVATEATGVYPQPVCRALTEHGDFGQVLTCNAGHVKNMPGRKTDLADAEWPAQLPGCGLPRGSFIPPAGVKAVRDVIRYRTKVARQRVGEIARPGDGLQDAGVKTGSVASPVSARSGRAVTGALIDGERRGPVLAELALGRMRSKIPDLSTALEGRFGAHHAMLCRLHLGHLDHLDAMLKELDGQIEAMMQPFRAARDLLATLPGIAAMSAAAVISETGTSPREFFPTAAHLASRAGICPGNHESAGKRRSGRRRHGNKQLQPVLVEIARGAVRHEGYLKSLFRRHVLRNGGFRSPVAENKAVMTVAHAILVIIWHVLDTGKPYSELGAGYFDRHTDPEREAARLIARLEALGKHVTLGNAA